MRVLMGLSCSQTGSIGVGSGSGALALLLGAWLLRNLGIGRAALAGAGLGLTILGGASGGAVFVALARTVLATGGGAVMRLALGALTGTTFCTLVGVSSAGAGSVNFWVVLRAATLEPAGMLTAWGLSLRMRVVFFTACSGLD